MAFVNMLQWELLPCKSGKQKGSKLFTAIEIAATGYAVDLPTRRTRDT